MRIHIHKRAIEVAQEDYMNLPVGVGPDVMGAACKFINEHRRVIEQGIIALQDWHQLLDIVPATPLPAGMARDLIADVKRLVAMQQHSVHHEHQTIIHERAAMCAAMIDSLLVLPTGLQMISREAECAKQAAKFMHKLAQMSYEAK